MAPKTKPIDLNPSQVLRFERARMAYQGLLRAYAEPLAQVEGAFHELQAITAEIVKASGQEANGATWMIEEEGECVRLIPKE